MRATIVVVLAFALGMLVERFISQPMDGYEVIKCKKVDQRGDTLIIENTMVKTR